MMFKAGAVLALIGLGLSILAWFVTTPIIPLGAAFLMFVGLELMARAEADAAVADPNLPPDTREER